jgi:hypothetical protein
MRSQVFALIVCVVMTAAASGQSLGDVAKEEAARRQTVAKSGKVYTNDTLKKEPASSAGSNEAPPTAAAPAPAANKPADEAKKTDEAKPSSEPAKGEAYWTKRLQAERDIVARGKTFAEALQSRINALSTDFVNRDDPAQRAQISADRQKALAELDRVKKEIDEHTKAIADIQEEGRKAGAPAGWLR